MLFVLPAIVARFVRDDELGFSPNPSDQLNGVFNPFAANHARRLQVKNFVGRDAKVVNAKV